MNETEALNRRLVELAQGTYVESDVLNVVEKIRSMYPMLDVQYLDPDRFPDLTDAPYRIVEHCRDGHTRIVFTTWILDNLVLDRIQASDTRKHDVLGIMERNNAEASAKSRQRFRDHMQEQGDILVHALKSPKGSYTFKKETDSGSKIVKIEDRGNTL